MVLCGLWRVRRLELTSLRLDYDFRFSIFEKEELMPARWLVNTEIKLCTCIAVDTRVGDKRVALSHARFSEGRPLVGELFRALLTRGLAVRHGVCLNTRCDIVYAFMCFCNFQAKRMWVRTCLERSF